MSDKHSDDRGSPTAPSDLVEPKSFVSETELAEVLDPFKEWHPYFMEALYQPRWQWIDSFFKWLQEKCCVRREQIFYSVIFSTIALIILQNFDPFICSLVSYFYPAYATTKALGKKRRIGVPGEREHWLTYWTVFAFFTLQDYYSGWLTASFPPFYLLKMLFLVLLALPTSGVSEKCYYLVVAPLLSKIDDAFIKYNVERTESLSSTQSTGTNSSEYSEEKDDETGEPDVSA
ncbi:Receptor expression-enhancing protein 5 [Toxocara canis]|uniref:Receptor expression-enhancing protein n=1 Tax=Toxocara canis TaxID=6265 RepID=A0A0B2VMQ2_TOXCA|nr:Receptor expression-enhancing protein 5 [Toxocara canis]